MTQQHVLYGIKVVERERESERERERKRKRVTETEIELDSGALFKTLPSRQRCNSN
jgi:hypothetical protein